jgi:hypothetical protein
MEQDEGNTYSFSDLSKLDYKAIIPDWGFTMTLLAPRSGGKTHLLNHLIYNLHKQRKYTAVFLFSHTALVQQGSYGFIPTVNKFDDLEHLEELLHRQEAQISNNKRKVKGKFIRSTILIIPDDIITDSEFRKNSALQKIFVQGRHQRDGKGSLTDCVILSQHFTALSPLVRKNTDFICMGRMDGYSDRKQLVESYLSITNSRKEAYLFLRSLNEVPYAFLIIWNTKSNKKHLTDYTFGIQAPAKLEKFKIGSKKSWKNNIPI